MLHDKRQERRRQALSGPQLAHLVAIAGSPAPDGHDHWTLRLLAGRAVELGYVRRISPETVRQALRKTLAAGAMGCLLAAGTSRGSGASYPSLHRLGNAL